MAIALVQECATRTGANAATTTEVIPITSAPSAGNTLILCTATRNSSITGCSVADSKGNTWTIDIGPLNTSNNFTFIASTHQNVGTLTTSDTVTITYGSAPTEARYSTIEEFSG